MRWGARRASGHINRWMEMTMTQTAEVFQFPNPPDRPVVEKRGAQLEDGYTRTANELVEGFMQAPLTSREARVIRAFERATFGWNQSSAWLAASTLSKMTGMPEGKCSEALNSLIRKRVLIRQGGSRSPCCINTVVSEWDFTAQKGRATPKRKPAPEWGESPQDGVTESPQDGETYKDRKDNSVPKGTDDTSKKSKPRKWGEEIDHTLTDEMVQAVSADLDAPIKHNPTTWANEFRLMRERDGRTVEQIRYLITWTAGHHFWSGVILSPAKLRAKWDQLAKQVKQSAKPKASSGRHTGLQAPSTDGLIDKGDGTYEF